MEPIRIVAYSDYLCPWCYNAAVRLWRLEREDPGVEVSWRSYLLRPRPSEHRDLEKFRAYTRSWLRPAAEVDAGVFRVWQGDAGPPSHSVPAQLVAKAAARVGPEAFRLLHERLFRGYFSENRDVSDTETLRELWRETGLPDPAFAEVENPALRREVLQEHQEALDCGASGVPSLRMADSDAVITGALPLASYQRWVSRERERRRTAAAGDAR